MSWAEEIEYWESRAAEVRAKQAGREPKGDQRVGSFNKIQIVGYLGRDAELRATPKGTSVASFSIATNEKRGDQDTTTWFRVSFWGQRAEVVAQWLTKGQQVYVSGRLSQQEFTGKDGAPRTSLEVNADDVQLLGSSGRQSSEAAEYGQWQQPASKQQAQQAPDEPETPGKSRVPF